MDVRLIIFYFMISNKTKFLDFTNIVENWYVKIQKYNDKWT